jgi:molybdopterin-guanine dinucleotide biosynthesis protein A
MMKKGPLMKKISCIILAGGKSKRMGIDKKFLLLEGKSLLEIAVEMGKSLSDEVIVSLGTVEQEKKVLARGLEVTTVVDLVQHKGPLAGLCTALRRCTKKYAAVIPCDTPLLKREVFLSLLEDCEEWDAVVPLVRGMPEPLVAVYRVEPMLKACEEAARAGRWKVGDVMESLKRKKYCPMDAVGFLNVNTPEDMREVERHGR